MKEIPLTQDKIAFVDDSDYPKLNKWKWFAVQDHQTYYAVRKITLSVRKQRLIFMHHFILKPPDGMEIDHINGNGLDNRGENLRTCNRDQNQWNQRLHRDSKISYKGVDRLPEIFVKRWRARIRIKNRQLYLGCFETAKDAAQAYDIAALKHHGQFARTNEMLGLI